MVRMSFTSGIRPRITGSAVNKEAARIGKAAFLAPLTAITPSKGEPPCIRNLSIYKSGPAPV